MNALFRRVVERDPQVCARIGQWDESACKLLYRLSLLFSAALSLAAGRFDHYQTTITHLRPSSIKNLNLNFMKHMPLEIERPRFLTGN
jgi:hypothetical protein